MELSRIIEFLDRCEFSALKCTRCGQTISEPLGPTEFMMCEKGRRHQIGWSFFCVGCDYYHAFYTVQPQNDARKHSLWQFDGNVQLPTFSPSLLIHGGKDHQCHLFLRAGVIEYLDDCSHPFKGRKVALASVTPSY